MLGDDTLTQIQQGNIDIHYDKEGHIMAQENGQHREMAVDVPESFIARNKTTPRYPPPRALNNQIVPPVVPQKPAVPARNDECPVPPPRGDTRLTTQSILDKQTSKIGQILDPTPDQMDSIKKFQEQLRKRREKEERIAAQNEFLRTSLRGSHKLHALESEPSLNDVPIGFDNEAYLGEEDSMEKMTVVGEYLLCFL